MELEPGLVEQLADGQQSIFFSDDFLLELLISAFQRPFGWVVLSFPAHLLFGPQWLLRPLAPLYHAFNLTNHTFTESIMS